MPLSRNNRTARRRSALPSRYPPRACDAPIPVLRRRCGHGRDSRRGRDTARRGRARVAGALPLLGGGGEGDRRADHDDDLPGAARRRVARIPAGIGGDRHGDIRHTDAADFVTIRIHRRDERGIPGALDGRILPDAPRRVRAEIDRDGSTGATRHPGMRRRGWRGRRRQRVGAATAVPSARRGKTLGGGGVPSVTQRSRLTSAARRSGA